MDKASLHSAPDAVHLDAVHLAPCVGAIHRTIWWTPCTPTPVHPYTCAPQHRALGRRALGRRTPGRRAPGHRVPRRGAFRHLSTTAPLHVVDVPFDTVHFFMTRRALTAPLRRGILTALYSST